MCALMKLLFTGQRAERFFEYDIDAGDINPITEYAAMDVIRRLDADRYIELFGEVPEA